MRENHYAIVARLKISYVSNYKISITLLILPKCRGQSEEYPMTKLAKISDMGSLHRGFLVTLH